MDKGNVQEKCLMKKNVLATLWLSATFFLIGCADDKARQQIADTNVKLSQIQQNVDVIGTKVSNQKLIDILNKLDDLQNQINELNGGVDTLKYEHKSHVATQEQINQSLQQQTSGQHIVAAGDEGKSETAEAAKSGSKEGGVNEELKNALVNIKKHKFSEANKELKEVIKTSTNPTIVASATYYLAVSYAANKQYKNAIATAKSFIEKNPDNSNAPDALRTIYISQIQLGQKKSAKTTANTLIDKYPDSHAAKKIQQEQSSNK
jgi:TolA-binding protein